MQLTAGTEIHYRGTGYQILYSDEVDVLLCTLDDRTQRERFCREDINAAYVNGEVVPFQHGFNPQDWSANIEYSENLQSYEFADESERAQVEYRLPYARYFAMNIVGADEQAERCQEIAEAQGHTFCPGASTARRWAARFTQSQFNPASLIDRRRKSFRTRNSSL